MSAAFGLASLLPALRADRPLGSDFKTVARQKIVGAIAELNGRPAGADGHDAWRATFEALVVELRGAGIDGPDLVEALNEALERAVAPRRGV